MASRRIVVETSMQKFVAEVAETSERFQNGALGEFRYDLQQQEIK